MTGELLLLHPIAKRKLAVTSKAPATRPIPDKPENVFIDTPALQMNYA
jgi:hypothetical protein